MENISRNNSKFQSFLESLIFIYQLFFGIEPENETKPYVFVSASEIRRIASSRARFELKKSALTVNNDRINLRHIKNTQGELI